MVKKKKIIEKSNKPKKDKTTGKKRVGGNKK